MGVHEPFKRVEKENQKRKKEEEIPKYQETKKEKRLADMIECISTSTVKSRGINFPSLFFFQWL